jgi:LacI family transcriptional regulator
VDRVLNERPGVRTVTIEKVQAAISELGYIRDTAAANLARRRIYNLLFLLPETENEFVLALRDQIAQQAGKLANDRTVLSLALAAPFDAQDFVAALDRIDPATTDGVALFSPETPSVRDALNRVREKGVAVVTLVSDLPSSKRDHFVGIDNVSAGKTAARLMGRFVRGSGKILFVTGSRFARDHLERRQGFDLVIGNCFKNLQVVASVEGRDDPDRIHALLRDAFANHANIRGVYSSAAGNEGLLRFLRESPHASDLVVIGHELTALSRSALQEGLFDAVISQDSGHIVRSCVRLLRATADNAPFNPAQELIRIDIYIKENTPP